LLTKWDATGFKKNVLLYLTNQTYFKYRLSAKKIDEMHFFTL